MSKIKNIQQERQVFKEAKDISKTLLNLAFSNISYTKNRYNILEKKLNILEEILKIKNIKPIGEEKFVCFSDGGFASKFNSNLPEGNILLGKYSKILGNKHPLSLFDVSKSPELILKNKENILRNLRFFTKNYKNNEVEEISIEKRLSKAKIPLSYIEEVDIKDIIRIYNKTFVQYSMFKAINYENHFRSKIMNGAFENSTNFYNKLTLKFNKVRQEIITNEMGIISVIVGVNNE